VALFFYPYICFMVNIQQVFNIVKDIVNKENNGFITPSVFNSFAHLAQSKIHSSIFSTLKDSKKLMRSGINPSRSSALDKKALEDMAYYAESDTLTKDAITGTFKKPLYLSRIISITTDGSTLMDVSTKSNIEILYDEEKIERLLKSSISKPTDAMPVALVSDRIEVYPTTVNKIKIRYYRVPSSRDENNVRTVGVPVYSASSAEVFNATASRHFDLPEHYLTDVVMEICAMAGVHMRDASAINYGGATLDKVKQERTA